MFFFARAKHEESGTSVEKSSGMFQGFWDFGSKVQGCSKESGTSVLKFRDVPRSPSINQSIQGVRDFGSKVQECSKESGTSVLKFRNVPRSLGLRF